MANIIVNFEFSRFFFLKLYDSLTLRSVWGLVYMIQYYNLSPIGTYMTGNTKRSSIYVNIFISIIHPITNFSLLQSIQTSTHHHYKMDSDSYFLIYLVHFCLQTT